jgi:hypothetical protein
MLTRLLFKHSRLPSAIMVACAMALMTLLSACGGGTSTTGVAPTDPTPPVTPPAPVLIAPGAYVASLNEKDWVAMLLPITQGNSTVTYFYGLYYNAADPDLYSGSGLFTNINTANFTRLSVYPNISAALRTGAGSLTTLGNGVVRAQLSFPATSTEQSKDISVAASAPSNYAYNSPANLNNVKGSWQGRWSYGFGAIENFSLNVSVLGDVTSFQTFQQDCFLTKGALAPSADGTNLFTFTLTVPNATQCSLKSQTLTGAAFVTASPVAGKTQRLYIAGVTTDGRGISYRADR